MNRWFDNFPILSKYFPGKIILSFFMLILAMLLAAIFNVMDRTICIFAMLFSFVGDIALNYPWKNKEKSNLYFMAGGISFIVAHLFYCVAYGLKIRNHLFKFFNPGVFVAIAILCVLTLFFFVMVKNRHNSKLFLFGIGYMWLTGIDYIVVFSYAYSINSIESIAFLGGLLFLASDFIIGCEKFLRMKSKIARELVWWFYPLGQVILILVA